MNEYTDDQLNELADWVNSLNIHQWFFLMDSYENFLSEAAIAHTGQPHVH